MRTTETVAPAPPVIAGASGTARPRWASVALGSAAGILVAFLLGWQFRRPFTSGANEFLQLYAGARLVGTPGLYNPDRVRQVQLEAAGTFGDALLYTRLPYWAWLLHPLTRLPYRTAYWIFELLAFSAFAAFAALWRPPAFSDTLLFSCLSLPAFVALLIGEDVTFLLLWIALAVRLEGRQKTFASGLVFSLCAAKFHLFVLLPLWILRQKLWRFAAGLAAGGAVLLAISFAAAGRGWPLAYYHLLAGQSRAIHPRAAYMPNLHGLFSGWVGSRPLEWLFVALVVAAVWIAVRHTSFQYGLAAVLAGGLLVSYHAYLDDCVLLLPAALAVRSSSSFLPLRFFSLVLLIPVTYLLNLVGPPLAALAPLSMLLLLCCMAIGRRCQTARDRERASYRRVASTEPRPLWERT